MAIYLSASAGFDPAWPGLLEDNNRDRLGSEGARRGAARRGRVAASLDADHGIQPARDESGETWVNLPRSMGEYLSPRILRSSEKSSETLFRF